MFHTFQAAAAVRSPAPGEGGDATKSGRASGSRRISTSNACVECRRRKIRCDGTQPCGQCLWYQHPEACSYAKPAQRVIPSRKLVDKLSGQVEQYRLILQRLFPTKNLDSLASLPRDELVNLALTLPTTSACSPIGSIPATTSAPTPDSEGGESLEAALEAAPDENPEWDEARKHQLTIQGISDDVNGLSLSVDRPSSYVGVSSITAALKVIVKTVPLARPYIDLNGHDTTLPSRSGTPPPPDFCDTSPTALPSMEAGLELLNHYFEKVHVFFPMVEEKKFRDSYVRGDRMDSAWLSLLNMVFALGSLSSSTSDNEIHHVYFVRSRHHISLETFGSGNLEVLQALGMMSGYYMHYLNRPNEANCLMGATLRMATGLGLHREYSEPAQSTGQKRSASEEVIAETRRRTWWSIFCLDVWASTTTSKPSLGRISSAVSVQGPGKVFEDVRSSPCSPLSHSGASPNIQNTTDLRILPLVHNVEFCKIGTRIQDRLATVPLLQFEELAQIDNDLVGWYDGLPTVLTKHNEPCPAYLRVPRSVMKWRYQNLRIVLHRPFVLSTALRRASFAQLPAEEKVAVGKCRVIACQTIEDISRECTADLISGWNGVWFAFQACIVILVSLFCDISNMDEIEKWRAHIEAALLYFDRMRSWSVAAQKSKDAIARLYEASKVHLAAAREQLHQQHSAYEQQLAQNAGRVDSMATPQKQAAEPTVEQRFAPPLPAQHFGGMSDLAGTINTGVGMGVWPANPNMAAAQGAPANLGNLTGFWDEMMWDNFPEVDEDQFTFGQFDFLPPASQDGTGLHGWQPGNQCGR